MRKYWNSDFHIFELSNTSHISLTSNPSKYNLAAWNNYADNAVENAVENAVDEITLVRTSRNIDFENNELSKISDVNLNFDPAISNRAAWKNYADSAIGEALLIGNIKNNDFNNQSSSNISQLLNSEPIDSNHAATKS